MLQAQTGGEEENFLISFRSPNLFGTFLMKEITSSTYERPYQKEIETMKFLTCDFSKTFFEVFFRLVGKKNSEF